MYQTYSDEVIRFGRIRLVECPGAEIRQNSPLVENGPDPVVDKDVFTEDYLKTIMRKRHVPVKALILDQAVISGVGNWVADESLYHAKLHPEQYCNEFSDEEVKRLHESIRYVCQTAVSCSFTCTPSVVLGHDQLYYGHANLLTDMISVTYWQTQTSSLVTGCLIIDGAKEKAPVHFPMATSLPGSPLGVAQAAMSQLSRRKRVT